MYPPAGSGARFQDPWNAMVLVAKGNQVTLDINGQRMGELIDNSPSAVKDGVIALQMHAGHTMTIQMKDVKIKLLNSK